jgi:uncharacterized protein involved in outer membrane biogenesis
LVNRLRAIAAAPRVRKALWWIAGTVVAYAVVGFLVLPPIVKSQLQKELSLTLHRDVTVQAVRVNPFMPSLTVRGLAVRERMGDALFAGFDELYVNLAAGHSIFRLAPVVDEMTLAKPQLRVVRNEDRTYNFQDLLDEVLARPADSAPAEAKPAKYALFNIQLLDGRVEFDDRAEGEAHTVSELRIGIPFISSLPAHVEIKVLPELSARVNDAPLRLAGEALPFGETRTTLVNVDLDGFDIVRLTDYLPFEPRAKLRSALLDMQLAVLFEQPEGGTPRLKIRGNTALRNVGVLDPQDRPVIAWERLAVELHEIEPLVRRFHLARVALDGADLHVRRSKDGTINMLELGPGSATPATAAAPKESSDAPLALKIDGVALDVRKLRFTDDTTSPRFEAALEQAKLEGSKFDLAREARSEWRFSARSDAGEDIRFATTATAEPLSAEGRIELTGVPLQRYQPYVDQAANVRIDNGQLELGLAFAWAEQALKLSDASLSVHGLRARLPEEKAPFIQLGSLAIKGAGADTAARTASLGDIVASGLRLALRREREGTFNVARVARPGGTETQEGENRPWRVDLPSASLAGESVTFEDLAVREPVKVSIAPLQIKAEGLSTGEGRRGKVALRATIDKRGRLSASGPVSLAPLAAQLNLDARDIAFTWVQPYLEDRLHLALTSGALSFKGAASVELPRGAAARASYRGSLEVKDFASIDKRLTQDLLKWKGLALRAVDFSLEPMKLSIDEIALADFYARIILSADGQLNLTDLVARREADFPVSSSGPAAAAGPRPYVRLGKVALRDGNVNFSDFFIRPNYKANLVGVGGEVTEMRPDRAGSVELRARLDNAAPVEIVGQVNALAENLFLDMKASVKDIEMAPLSPYSVKYAGYGIERGKLSWNAKYHVAERKLSAENQIYLDQLTFGERVESPTATKLPVTLAIALLKDRNGVIDLNLPISGSLDDPQFSVGGLIVRVLVNLVTKAITSPFALLGALAGGSEELSHIDFAPGSSALTEAGQRKLQGLAKALTERPGLKLTVAGRVAPETDREGLKRGSLERKVRAQKFEDLRRAGAAPESPEAIAIAAEEYEKYLRRAYGAEKFDKPRTALGFTKTLDVPEMEKLILANTSIGEDDLRLLANARAQAAKEWLVTQGKIPAERVFLLAPKLGVEELKEKGAATRAEFGLR